jgi:hypothetical protein
MSILPAIFAFLVGVAGWYYLFYSQAARKLQSIEDPRLNRRRRRLRQANGVRMLLLAVSFSVLMYSFLPKDEAVAAVATIALIALLLIAILVLALIDVRLTARLRAKLREQRKP